jgi:putative restriction endonuclease
MKEGQTLWTREQLILAINLYCKMPFGKMHRRNPQIIELANLIGRKPGAVARKLGNFASFDPTLQARGIKGLTNAGKLDKQVWDEFYNNWDAAIIASEQLLAEIKNTSIEDLNEIDIPEKIKEGQNRMRLVNTRLNQNIFRKIVLATYNFQCCITGIENPELLVASHIVPWSVDESNRLNPMNGLALNALHDKAFDAGLITIDADTYKMIVSDRLKVKSPPTSVRQNFLDLEGIEIKLPSKFLPDREFLKRHNETRFK